MLLDKDPGGNTPADLLNATGILADNIRTTGYGEVGDPAQGGLFRPHATLNWFELGTNVETANVAAPEPSELDGAYTALGVYLLGPFGTCPQRIALFSCKPAA